MKFLPTSIAGAFLVEPVPHHDERGSFARTFGADEFAARGLDPAIAQCNVSVNLRRGTLRGLHSQRAPHAQAKLVRCTRGAIHDVIVDLRPNSSTFLRHVGVELSATSALALYIPKGVFHGFLTLTDDSEVFYQMSNPYVDDAAAGYRWNDPAFAIIWPDDVAVISARDASYPDYQAR